MITALDTNVLLDVLIPNAAHVATSRQLLDRALGQGALVICEVVYAEMATQFNDAARLDSFIQDTGIRLDASPREALLRASEAWGTYLRARRPACPQCGAPIALSCPGCQQPIKVRQHILSDFLIGGHAMVRADRFLTRDLGYYRTYFKELPLMTL